MKKTDHPQNPFRGQWKVGDLYECVRGKSWKRRRHHAPGGMVWEFEEELRWASASGAPVFEGKLTEHIPGRCPEATRYAYYSGTRLLFIDRSAYEPDGFCSICLDDRYRVEPRSRNKYRLYDLKEVEREPEEYTARFAIKRL